jgi:hypothetical protein
LYSLLLEHNLSTGSAFLLESTFELGAMMDVDPNAMSTAMLKGMR